MGHHALESEIMTEQINGTTPSLLSAARKDNKLAADISRQGWEREWLQQNQLANQVIKQGDETSGNDSATLQPSIINGRVEAHNQIASTATQSLRRLNSEAGSQRQTFITDRVASFTGVDTSGNVVYAETPRLYTRPNTSGGVMSESNTPALLEPQLVPLKSFALWRDENKLSISMRLKNAEALAPGVIATLRDWLRSTDMKLKAISINGKSVFNTDSDTPTAAPTDTSSLHAAFTQSI